MPARIIVLFLFARDKTESRPTYLYCCIAALHARVDAFSILEIGQIVLQASRPLKKKKITHFEYIGEINIEFEIMLRDLYVLMSLL